MCSKAYFKKIIVSLPEIPECYDLFEVLYFCVNFFTKTQSCIVSMTACKCSDANIWNKEISTFIYNILQGKPLSDFNHKTKTLKND